MPTTTALDLGSMPAAAPSAPSVRTAGPGFARALDDATTGTERQAPAAPGKSVPVAVAAPEADCEMPADAAPPKAEDGGDTAPDPGADSTETGADPALAWLMPPVAVTPAADTDIPAGTPAAPAPVAGLASPLPDCKLPAAPPELAEAGASKTDAPAQDKSGPDRLVPFLTVVKQALADATAVPALVARDPRLEPPPTLQPVRLAPEAALPPALVAAATKEAPGSLANTTTDAAILSLGTTAPAHTVAPAASGQQAGLDLTQDSGLHRMIDRIEQLRDGAEVRETRIRLIPDALGTVDIAVRRAETGDHAGVRVHFAAAEPTTRQLIVDAQQRLTELAETRGIRIERTSVDAGVAGGGGQTWTGDGQARPQSQPAQPVPPAPTSVTGEAADESNDKRIA